MLKDYILPRKSSGSHVGIVVVTEGVFAFSALANVYCPGKACVEMFGLGSNKCHSWRANVTSTGVANVLI